MYGGTRLYGYHWLQASYASAKGTVLIVHGLGEHAGRYASLAQHLNVWGWDVFAYDQLGHGRSPGKRGAVPHPCTLVQQLGSVISELNVCHHIARPLILLGHSMGGLVAAQYVLHYRGENCRIQGLVLSSPALRTHMNLVQRVLARLGRGIAGGLCLDNGLDSSKISHDRAQVAAYQQDPLVHRRISVLLADAIASGGRDVLRKAAQWPLPTLLLYAGDDALVDAEGSRSFARQAPPNLVHSREFPELYHEIFNEADNAVVFDALQAWLARFQQPH